MRKLLLFLPLISLLTACQSKKEICALSEANEITQEVAMKKLGIELRGDHGANWRALSSYCSYYKH